MRIAQGSLTSKDLNFDNVILKQSIYEQNLVFRIDQGGLIHPIYSMAELKLAQEHYPKDTIKIEGMEKWSNVTWDFCNHLTHALGFRPVTAHLFAAPKDGHTFGDHTDPDDVYMFTLSGTKRVVVTKQVATIVDGEQVTEAVETIHDIAEGNYLFIPAGTTHRAVNAEQSVMLSVSAEKWFLDKV